MSDLKSRIRGVSVIFACGMALFSDGYSNGVIGSVNTLLNRIYGPEVLAQHNYGTTLTSVTYAGTIVGMLLFGYLSDKIGRKFGMMTASGIIFLFAGLSATSKGANGSVGGMLSMLIAMRFLLGIGIGAEYPCGSVSASEQSEEPSIAKIRQHRWFALATNTMIDFGFVVAAFVPLVLFWIFGNNHLRAVWRLSLGLGVVPALLVFLWRLNMDEPRRYKTDCMKRTRIRYTLVIRRYWKNMLPIAVVWFLYNFIVYPFGIYSSIVVDNITGGDTSLTTVLGWNVVINSFYMPGTLSGVMFIDYIGPKNTMALGLVCQSVIGFIMSGLYVRLTNNVAAFAVVYGIFLSFGEFGPGNNLGLLASKTSATAVRGQFYGVVAAFRKIGALVAFPPMIDAFGGAGTTRGNTGPFWVGSGIALASAVVTFFFVKPLNHDGMVKEDEEFRRYLEAHGFDTSTMGIESEATTVTSSSDTEKNDSV